jgi:hypothetical protein
MPRKKKGTIGLMSAAAVGCVALLAVASWELAPSHLLTPASSPNLDLEQGARAVWRDARVRAGIEFGVVFFQVAGVTALILSRLLPMSRWADRGRVAFVGAMIGLGMAGILCAWYGSEFALFAGCTMAILLNVVILGIGHSHPALPSRSCRIAVVRETPLTA